MYRKLTLTAALPVALAFAACGEDAEPEPRLLFSQEQDPAQCDTGGVAISSGIDRNRDGVLDADEIESTEVLCDGAPGDDGDPGADALVRTAVVDPGDDCPEGGLRVQSGFDANDNGQLDEPEVDATTLVCNQAQGPAGRNYLVQTSTIQGGACDTAAGVVVESGLDDDGDGALSEAEIDDVQTVCAGQLGFDVRVELEAEPPGTNCTGGGQRLTRGTDRNRNGILDGANEIDDVVFICDPLSTLVETTAVAPGPDCPEGGTQVDRGLDTDGNGVLDPVEIVETVFVCTGPDGLPNLVATATVGPGADCANGGVRIESGLDDNMDGVLQASEVDVTSFACDGAGGADGRNGSAVRIADEPAGANCALGGTRIETGADTDANGQLDDDEVSNTRYVCDGEATATLVSLTTEPSGSNCLNGGQRVDSGVDANLDGVLQTDEIDSTTYVCSNTNVLPIAILTARDLGTDLENESFSASIEATGGLGGYTWQVAPGDQLPPGLSIGSSGTPSTSISGTATATGTFVFDVLVRDFVGSSAEATFEITIDPLPCEPGVGGLAGTDSTTVNTSASIDSTAYGIEADADASGYVYINGTGSFIRIAKDGSSDDDVETLAGVSAGDLTGYDVKFDGDDVYVVPSAATGTVGRVTRISTDGGQTFSIQDMLDFGAAGAPTDLRSVAVDGDTMYAITHDRPCTLYEADISGTLPATASLLFTLTGYLDCSGMQVDASYVYTTAGGTPSDSIEDAVIRIDRVTGAVDELFADFITFNLDDSGYNDLELQDGDGDGTPDVLWAAGDGGDRRYICTPGQSNQVPFFSAEFASSISGDNGIAYDSALNALWLYNETSDDLFRLE